MKALKITVLVLVALALLSWGGLKIYMALNGFSSATVQYHPN